MLAVLLLNQMHASSIKRRISERQSALKANKRHKNSSRDKYCRTCLGTDELESIFPTKTNDEKRTHELQLVTGLQIKKNDGLSQKMCLKCMDTMTKTLQFRKTCRKTEKSLLKMLTGIKPKKRSSRLQKSMLKEVVITEPDIEEINAEVKEHGMFDDFFQNDDYFEDYNDVCEDSATDKMERQPSCSKRIRTPNASSYKCTTCNKDFKMKASYRAHMRFHTNYCVCETCGKRCRNNNQMQEHKRARHGLGRIHKCAYCEYSSATKEALTIHERRHTGERPYICDHCGATFHRRANLVQHIAIHLPEKNFQCDMCPKRLKSKKFLQIHKHNAHTGKKYGYLCPVCEHRFEKPNKVRAHTRRVHGIPDDSQAPICNLCNKLEKSQKRLQIHIYNTHRAPHMFRHVCPLCPKSYKKNYHVRRHLVRIHGVPRDKQGRIEKINIEGFDIATKQIPENC